jgi:hypothetical protein
MLPGKTNESLGNSPNDSFAQFLDCVNVTQAKLPCLVQIMHQPCHRLRARLYRASSDFFMV